MRIIPLFRISNLLIKRIIAVNKMTLLFSIIIFAFAGNFACSFCIKQFNAVNFISGRESESNQVIHRRVSEENHFRLNFNHAIPVLKLTEIAIFGEESEEESDTPVKPKTHGYEGDFQVGDIVKVKKPIRIWSVKQYAKEGFICEGFVGRVSALVLYGRKYNTLCSAITPIKVEFQPDDSSIPEKMFDRKWVAHFAATELELLSREPLPAPPS